MQFNTQFGGQQNGGGNAATNSANGSFQMNNFMQMNGNSMPQMGGKDFFASIEMLIDE